MATAFIGGSIAIREVDPKFKDEIRGVVAQGADIVIGDAHGADTSIQKYLLELRVSRVTVFCSGERPRNNLGGWPIHPVATAELQPSRTFYMAKDLMMAEIADFGLMTWDSKSTGTLSNVIELVRRNKTCAVFISKDRQLARIGSLEDLQWLFESMPTDARERADQKIEVLGKLRELKEQFHSAAATPR